MARAFTARPTISAPEVCSDIGMLYRDICMCMEQVSVQTGGFGRKWPTTVGPDRTYVVNGGVKPVLLVCLSVGGRKRVE
jgi:hypothetical protein